MTKTYNTLSKKVEIFKNYFDLITDVFIDPHSQLIGRAYRSRNFTKDHVIKLFICAQSPIVYFVFPKHRNDIIVRTYHDDIEYEPIYLNE